MESNTERKREKSKGVLKVLMLFSMIYFFFVSFMIFSIYYLKLGYDILQKVKLTLPGIILVGCILYAAFTIVAISIYIDYKSFLRKIEERKKPKPIFYKGKRMYVYTYPEGAKGGIFSRTIIPIDEDTVVNVRCQILKADEIW